MLTKIVSVALAMSLLGIGTAYAEPWERHNAEYREGMRDGYRDFRRDEHREWMRDESRERMWGFVRGARFVPEPGFMVVANWGEMRLPPPAFGFHWVRVRGNFLLVNNRTGVIADVLFDRF